MRYRSLSVYIQDQWEIHIKYVPFKIVSIDKLIRPLYNNFVSLSHFGLHLQMLENFLPMVRKNAGSEKVSEIIFLSY